MCVCMYGCVCVLLENKYATLWIRTAKALLKMSLTCVREKHKNLKRGCFATHQCLKSESTKGPNITLQHEYLSGACQMSLLFFLRQ